MSDGYGLAFDEDSGPFGQKTNIDHIGENKLNEADAGAMLCWPSMKYINPVWPNVADIDIRDIAHSLSLICRYTGHIPTFYSVAQHSLIVSSLVPHEYRLAALLHDAEEAYIGDWSSPLKHSLKKLFPSIGEVGIRLRRVIYERAGVDPGLYYRDAIIKTADNSVYLMERRAFWHKTAAISFMQPQDAEQFFLEQYKMLKGKP
jgi:hypothetical protein